jgi:hypothetical protein
MSSSEMLPVNSLRVFMTGSRRTSLLPRGPRCVDDAGVLGNDGGVLPHCPADLDQGGVPGQACDADSDIAVSQYPGRPAVPDDDGPHVLRAHRMGGLLDGRVGRHGDDRSAHELPEHEHSVSSLTVQT